ncbi:MAG: DUF5602 domain-containing protein [Vulcanimicrobiaceae bacterium]
MPARPPRRAYAWVRNDTKGKPAAFGLSFDAAALSKLGDVEQEIVLPLPAAPGLPFRTAVIDWNPHGHPPAHVYDVPHFDFHFYSIGEDARMAIAPAGPAADALAPADLAPPGFITDGATVPMMGKHYLAASQPEFNGGTFTATPIYGFYDGHMVFVESMVTVAYLQTHPALTMPLPQPSRVEVPGAYPTRWSATYDTKAQRFDIAFDALVPR